MSSSSCCRLRSDKDWFHHLTVALHLSLCCESDVQELIFMSLSFRFLLMVSLNRRRGRPLFLWPEDSWEYRTCFGSLSGDILMTSAGKLVDADVWIWLCIKVEKQAEVLIDKYYSCAKVIHKGVLDIYWVAVLVKFC